MKATTLIRQLQKIVEERGDVPVYFQSDYDWALPIGGAIFCKDPEKKGWDYEGVPKNKPLIYLN